MLLFFILSSNTGLLKTTHLCVIRFILTKAVIWQKRHWCNSSALQRQKSFMNVTILWWTPNTWAWPQQWTTEMLWQQTWLHREKGDDAGVCMWWRANGLSVITGISLQACPTLLLQNPNYCHCLPGQTVWYGNLPDWLTSWQSNIHFLVCRKMLSITRTTTVTQKVQSPELPFFKYMPLSCK